MESYYCLMVYVKLKGSFSLFFGEQVFLFQLVLIGMYVDSFMCGKRVIVIVNLIVSYMIKNSIQGQKKLSFINVIMEKY